MGSQGFAATLKGPVIPVSNGLELGNVLNETAEPGSAPPSTPDPNFALLRFCLDRVTSLEARAGNHGTHRGNIVDVGDFHYPD